MRTKKQTDRQTEKQTNRETDKIQTRLCSENKPLGNPSGCLAAKIPNFRLELKILFQMRGQITKFLQRNSKGRIKGNFEIYAPPRPTLTKLY